MKRLVSIVAVVLASLFLLSGCSTPEQKEALARFDVEKARIEQQISTLNNLAKESEELADAPDKALNEDLRPSLRQAAKDAYNTAAAIKVPAAKSKVEDIDEQVVALKGVDLTPDIEAINAAKKALSDSFLQYKLVDNPTADYVLECLRRIDCLDKVVALTEETDPTNEIGKPGRYTGKVVAHSVNVEHYGYDSGARTLEDIGNPAGGCVEIYASEDDAQRRDADLKAMEGTIRNPGAHRVIGTIVLRASENQKTSDMDELVNRMQEELTRL